MSSSEVLLKYFILKHFLVYFILCLLLITVGGMNILIIFMDIGRFCLQISHQDSKGGLLHNLCYKEGSTRCERVEE